MSIIKNRLLKKTFVEWSFILPTIIILALVLAYPILYTVNVSFSDFNMATFRAGEWVGFANYEDVFYDYRFWDSLTVTLFYLLIALPLQVLLGFIIAYLINTEWRARGIIRALFILPMVVAPIVSGGVWRMILSPQWGIMSYITQLFGLEPLDWFGNPTLALIAIVIIDTWEWTPFVVLIATAALLSLPQDVFEAAKIDGAGWFSTLWHVALPLLTPVICAIFVIRWLGAVKLFDIVLASTLGGPGKATSVINLFIYEEAFRSLNFAGAAAMAMVVLLLTLILTSLFLSASRKIEEKFS